MIRLLPKAACRGRLRRRADRRHSTDRRHACSAWSAPTSCAVRASKSICRRWKFGAVVKRRTSQSPPDKGGWNVFFTLIDRSIPNIHPFGNPALRADGTAAFDGWPDSPRIEELRRAWLDAGDISEQCRIAAELQMQV